MTLPTEIAGAWAHGWTSSRQMPAPAPLTLAGEPALEVPSDFEDRRIVLLRPTVPAFREAMDLLSSVPNASLRLAGDDDDWQPHLNPGWTLDEPGWFMTRRVEHRTADELGDAYEVSVETDSARTVVVISSLDDQTGRAEPVAQGHLGVAGRQHPGWGTIDQIWTLPEHRQRGLGRRVMIELENAAHERGLTDLVLTSSPMGLMLYDSCGWSEVSRCVWAVTTN